MASVTFPVSVGGDGSTVSDDSSPTTGLGNGGHRTRFVPALAQVVAVAGNTVTQATNAAASASAASTSATLAQNAPGTQATTTTSLSISLGSKSLTLAQTGKNFVVGQYVQIVSTASTDNWMVGAITAFTSGTGAMTVNVTHIGGTGTIAAWAVTPGLPPNLPSQSGNSGLFLSTNGSNASWTSPLPTQAGNAGRVLKTNGTAASWDVALSVGAVITGNTTLTATDAPTRSVAMTGLANSITLPVATTLPNGWEYIFDNNGSREFGVRSNGGQLLATVQPGITARIVLVDNTTSAGTWGAYGEGLLQPLTIADVDWGSTYGGSSSNCEPWVITLSTTLSLHFLINTTGSLFVYAVDCATYPATIGTPVQVALNTEVAWGLQISATKALIYSEIGVGYHITVSGTTCTVSAAGMSSAGDQFKKRWQGYDGEGAHGPSAVLMGASNDRVLSVDASGNVYLIDITGAAPSSGLGSANIRPVGYTSASPPAIYIYRVADTTAIVFMVANDGGGNNRSFARLVSYSGTTVTAGNQVSLDTGNLVGSSPFRDLGVAQLSATSYITAVYNSTSGRIELVGMTISGSTITASAVNNTASAGSWSPAVQGGGPRGRLNLYAVNSTSAVLTWINNSGSSFPTSTLYTWNGTTLSAPSYVQTNSSVTPTSFCQNSSGFITASAANSFSMFSTVMISGTSMSVSGSAVVNIPGNTGVGIADQFNGRFLGWSISGGYGGYNNDPSRSIQGRMCLFRFRANSPPQMLDDFSLNNSTYGQTSSNDRNIPAELAPNRVSFATTCWHTTTTTAYRTPKLQILEFPA